MADAVVREDDNGNRYLKTIEHLGEIPVPKGYPEAWGGEGFGYFYELKPITKEEYVGFGKTWDWSPITGKKRFLNR